MVCLVTGCVSQRRDRRYGPFNLVRLKQDGFLFRCIEYAIILPLHNLSRRRQLHIVRILDRQPTCIVHAIFIDQTKPLNVPGPSIWQLHTNVPGPLKQHFSYAAIGQSFRTVVSDMATSKNESLVFVVICICTASTENGVAWGG